MAAFISCHHNYSSSLAPPTFKSTKRNPIFSYIRSAPSTLYARHLPPLCSSQTSPPPFRLTDHNQKDELFSSLKKCAISVMLAVGLLSGVPGQANANVSNPALPDVSVLISGPPIKDPGALLRYALPIDNKAIREVQKPLEDISESLKLAGVKAIDSAERNVRQASRALKQGKAAVISGLAKSKVEHGTELLNKLEAGLDEFQQILEDKNRDAVAPKQKELLNYVGG
nr:peptidyl-prolyl cis-trans isomerase CYP38, chloroplastic [Ipomoea batatas]